jgi:hypothetical protein
MDYDSHIYHRAADLMYEVLTLSLGIISLVMGAPLPLVMDSMGRHLTPTHVCGI